MERSFFPENELNETYANMTEGQYYYLKDIINKIVEKIEKLQIPRFKKSIESGASDYKELEVIDVSTDDLKSIVKKYVGDLEHEIDVNGHAIVTRNVSDTITLTQENIKYLIDEYGKDGDLDLRKESALEILHEIGLDSKNLDYHHETIDDVSELQIEAPTTTIYINLPTPKSFLGKREMEVA